MSVSFKDRAYQHIRSKLLRGGFVAGERLSEEALAEEIGISRTPVREALNRLASEGLAKQLPHYGVFVRKFEHDELAELYDLREILESYAAGHAAERRTKSQMAKLEAICNDMKKAVHEFRASSELSPDLTERQSMLDAKFHAALFEAADCPQTTKVALQLRLLTQLCGRKQFMPGENVLRILAKTLREHMALVRAMKRRDSAAARSWMSRHLQRGKAEGLAMFDQRGDGAPPSPPRQQDPLEWYGLIGNGSAKTSES